MKESERKKYEVEVHSKIVEDYSNVMSFKGSKLFHEYWNNELTKFCNKGRILDNGCGSGILLKELKNAYGCDISFDMLKAAKMKNLVNADSEKLPFKDKSFDAVFCRGSLHHFHSYEKGLKEIKRVLKKNGKLIISEPFDNFLIRIPRALNKMLNKERFSKHKVLDKKFFDVLEKDFKIIKKEYFGYIGMPILSSPEVFFAFRLIARNEFLSRFLIFIDKTIAKIPLRNKLSWHINLYCEV